MESSGLRELGPRHGRTATKTVSTAGLAVIFRMEMVGEETPAEGTYWLPHLATGQIEFANKSGTLLLAEVPPVLFSELMRDVDLFVSVAGLGNDPAYGTRANAAHGAYWTQAAFGTLTETGKTRRAVLQDVLPGLSIADRCRLEERLLVVTGKLRTYRIHLGSANIRMEPNDQYLCMVQDRQNAGSRVRLPFEGDNTLSLILSKAFLLADDDKITDQSILSQIKYH